MDKIELIIVFGSCFPLAKTFAFNTEEEKNAFIKGMEYQDGSHGFVLYEDKEEYKVARKKYIEDSGEDFNDKTALVVEI